MTRLPVIDAASAPPAQRDALVEWGRDRGQTHPPGALWRMLVIAPQAMRPIGKLGAFVRVGTSLDPLVQEVGALIACAERGFVFEIDIHEKKIKALGVDPELVYRASSGRPTGLPPAPAAVACLAYAMARGQRVSDPELAQLVELLGEELLVEVLTVIGYFLMISDLARVLEPDT
jgi:4-carboxymuconolactone decarboxylase